MLLVIFLLVVIALLIAALSVTVYRLIQYDDFVQFLNDDIAGIVVFMRSLVAKDLFSNAPEVIAAHREFNGILEKMERYRDIIKKRSVTSNVNGQDKPKDRRPVVID